jgi:deltex-like protein
LALHSPGMNCVICLEERLAEKSVRLVACGHTYHLCCTQDALQHNPHCPTCLKAAIGTPQGRMPSETRAVSRTHKPCRCNDPTGGIVITDQIPSGTQKSYHPHPGQPYSGAKRTAYVPDTLEGRKLLNSLWHSFSCGLTFAVG